jgi:hypothetical protein
MLPACNLHHLEKKLHHDFAVLLCSASVLVRGIHCKTTCVGQAVLLHMQAGVHSHHVKRTCRIEDIRLQLWVLPYPLMPSFAALRCYIALLASTLECLTCSPCGQSWGLSSKP